MSPISDTHQFVDIDGPWPFTRPTLAILEGVPRWAIAAEEERLMGPLGLLALRVDARPVLNFNPDLVTAEFAAVAADIVDHGPGLALFIPGYPVGGADDDIIGEDGEVVVRGACYDDYGSAELWAEGLAAHGIECRRVRISDEAWERYRQQYFFAVGKGVDYDV